MKWPSFAQRAMLTARYTLLSWDVKDPELPLRLGRALINDPEEGVTDGSYRPQVIRERNLRRENRLRQHFRLFLDDVEQYAHRHVIDVLPFSWEMCGASPGDARTVFQWLVHTYGRLNMMVQVARRHFNASIIQSPTGSPLCSNIPSLSAAVTCRKQPAGQVSWVVNASSNMIVSLVIFRAQS